VKNEKNGARVVLTIVSGFLHNGEGRVEECFFGWASLNF
jgi:hypothetical protein